MQIPASHTEGWLPRNGLLTVTTDEIGFDPHRGERLLGARPYRIPVAEVTAVETAARRGGATSSDRMLSRLRVVTDRRVHLFNVAHADRVARHATEILSGRSPDRDETRRLEDDVQRTTSSGLLVGAAVVALLFLVQPLLALVTGDAPGPGHLVMSGVGVLLLAGVLVMVVRDRRT